VSDKRRIVAGLVGLTMVTAAAGQATEGEGGQVQDPGSEGVDLTTSFVDSLVNEPVASDLATTFNETDFETYVTHNGPYLVGYISVSTIIDTDFDGTWQIVDPGFTEGMTITEFEQGLGFGAGLGFRYDEFAFELFYERSEYDTTVLGSDFNDAVMHTVNLDVRYYFMTDTPLQPHVQVGFLLPWLDIHQAAHAPVVAPTQFGDAELTGWGVSLGGGASYYFTPKIAVSGTIGWRQIWYNRIEGVFNQELRPPGGTLDGSGLFARAGIMISF